MQRTRIEWCDYAVNPVKGLCPVDCKDNHGKSYCYARSIYKRFKLNPEIRFDEYALKGIDKIPEGSIIFVGSTMELFGEWIKPAWINYIFEYCWLYPEHIFVFLTKKPENLYKWSPFPDNCWVGVSVITKMQLFPACWVLGDIQCNVKFISFEPLLENVIPPVLPAEWDDIVQPINWVIIGQKTPYSPKTAPQIEWIDEIIQAAHTSNIPVFLKDNLKPIIFKDALSKQYALDKDFLNWKGELRQEFPRLENKP